MRYVINTLLILFNSIDDFQTWEYVLEKLRYLLLGPILLDRQAESSCIWEAPSHEFHVSELDIPSVPFAELVSIVAVDSDRVEDWPQLMPSPDSHELEVLVHVRKNLGQTCKSREVFYPFLHFHNVNEFLHKFELDFPVIVPVLHIFNLALPHSVVERPLSFKCSLFFLLFNPHELLVVHLGMSIVFHSFVLLHKVYLWLAILCVEAVILL